MIETFYGMRRMPFTPEATTASIFHSPVWDETLSRLQYAVDQAGWALVTGECGVGKSTVIRHLCQHLDPATTLVGYLADSKLTPWTLYSGILAEWGQDIRYSGWAAKRAVHRELAHIHRRDRMRTVLVIDEAQRLSHDVLDELRYLRNEAMDDHSLVALRNSSRKVADLSLFGSAARKKVCKNPRVWKVKVLPIFSRTPGSRTRKPLPNQKF